MREILNGKVIRQKGSIVMKLKNKKIIVTGGSSGMGAAAIKVFSKEGAEIVSVDINLPKNFGRLQGVTYLEGDISNQLEIREKIKKAVEIMGGVDSLFNIAGINNFIPTLEISEDALDRILSVNVKGVFYSCQAVYPFLKERGGSIINFGSQASYHPGPDSAHYAASKAAVESFTTKIAWEWGKHKIRANTVWPSAWTPLFENTVLNGKDTTAEQRKNIQDSMSDHFALGYLGDPEEDISPALVFLASDDSKYITGQVIPINGGSAMVH